jgi:hypothetical protein
MKRMILWKTFSVLTGACSADHCEENGLDIHIEIPGKIPGMTESIKEQQKQINELKNTWPGRK